MDLSELDSCDICTEAYDESRRPHSMPCGHTMCSCCVTNGINVGGLKCPWCQKTHNISTVNDVPINYNMESIIIKLKETQLGAILKAINPTNKAKSMKSRGMEILKEQIDILKDTVKTAETRGTDLKEYRKLVQARKAKHQDLSTVIVELRRQNEAMITLSDSENEKLERVLKEGEFHLNEANCNLLSLVDPTNVTNIESKSEKLEEIYDGLAIWNKNSTKDLPCVKLVLNSERIESIATALRLSLESENETESVKTSDQLDSSLFVMDKVKTIVTNRCSRSQKNMTRSLKFLLQTGDVYAIQSKDGRLRSARVTEKGNIKYLHYLQDTDPPQYGYFVKHSDLIEALNTDCVVAFLDLAWDGTLRGRVHINLSPDTPLAKHFWTLCTGHLGPSYANSKYLEVEDKGDLSNESVIGGDYEYNNGSGGAPVFKGLEVGAEIYKHKFLVGSLQAAYSGNDTSVAAQFRIFTAPKENGTYGGIFGQVKDGLHIVREAAKLDDITKVTISDCGVVLPFYY